MVILLRFKLLIRNFDIIVIEEINKPSYNAYIGYLRL